jgi:hypothetical protein
MSYGARTNHMYRSTGVYAGWIRNSASAAAALPVKPSARFEFAVDNGTANALRISVPKRLLARADAIIGWLAVHRSLPSFEAPLRISFRGQIPGRQA